MKKYQVKCHGGCGKALGTLELPDDRPLTTQASEYYCTDCGKKLQANIGSREAAPEGTSKEQQVKLDAFKAKISTKKTVAPADLDELVGILFGK